MLKDAPSTHWAFGARGFHLGDIIEHNPISEKFHTSLIVGIKTVQRNGIPSQAIRMLNLATGKTHDWCYADFQCEFTYVEKDA